MATKRFHPTPLSERDLDFVVQAAAPDFKDKAQLKTLIKEDSSFRKGLLETRACSSK